MAKNIYVSPTGNDADSGLTALLPKATINGVAGVQAIVATGDCIRMMGGVYAGPDNRNIDMNQAKWVNVLFQPYGNGVPIVDFEQVPGVYDGHIRSDYANQNLTFVGIQFRNPSGTKWCFWAPRANCIKLVNCALYQKAGPAGTGYGAGCCSIVDECSFYNLARGCQGGLTSDLSVITNCYFKSVTTVKQGVYGGWDFNAYPGNVEANGLNTSLPNTDPGFKNVTIDDYRLDWTDAVAIAKFRALGVSAGFIGALGTDRWYYDSRFPQTRFMSHDPAEATRPVWENDSSYTDPGGGGFTGAIIEHATTKDLEINLVANPAARSGRVMSNVIDLGSGSVQLDAVMYGAFEDNGLGAVIDIDTSLPKRIERRSSAVAFLKGDALPAWVAYAKGSQETEMLRYHQIRMTFHTDHTGV